MSNPESFIDEVTEEVRRDRLFALFRKYGWIPILLILLVVGGSAWSEWQKARALAEAEAFGDALLTAMDADTPEARRAALASVPATDAQRPILRLVEASDAAQDRAATLAALDALIADKAAPQAYHDLAVLRRVVLLGAGMPAADRRTALDGIAVAGRAYRPLAVEQLAYLSLETGDREAAVTGLQSLLQDQEAPQGLRRRAGQVLTALGLPPAEAPAQPATGGTVAGD